MLSTEIAGLVQQAIEGAQGTGALPEFDIPQIPVERPKQEQHGDFATPVCLQLARLARMAPMRIAEVTAFFMTRRNEIRASSWWAMCSAMSCASVSARGTSLILI